jgi:hypothetical protein
MDNGSIPHLRGQHINSIMGEKPDGEVCHSGLIEPGQKRSGQSRLTESPQAWPLLAQKRERISHQWLVEFV